MSFSARLTSYVADIQNDCAIIKNIRILDWYRFDEELFFSSVDYLLKRIKSIEYCWPDDFTAKWIYVIRRSYLVRWVIFLLNHSKLRSFRNILHWLVSRPSCFFTIVRLSHLLCHFFKPPLNHVRNNGAWWLYLDKTIIVNKNRTKHVFHFISTCLTYDNRQMCCL